MAKYQVIYTSCKRGIDGVNDGQQVFSYTEGFQDSKRDEIKGIFSYQVPNLPAGVVMTEELAPTMPRSFKYKLLSDNKCAIALNTYLGRDYMGSAGRFGNFLSHSIVADFDELDIYPCEMFENGALKSYIEYELVNNPNPPEYLPIPLIEKGEDITIDSVIDFLDQDDNLEHFKSMFACLLQYEKTKKRIIINDYPRNIVYWIAALQYAFPKEIAKIISFNSYEFDPELSSYQICGVVNEGSKYEMNRYVQSGRHFVFDFINNNIHNDEVDEALIDFLDVSFGFSIDSLFNFQNFIIDNTRFKEKNERYYDAYLYYSIFFDSMSDINGSQFKRIVEFAEEYAGINELVRKIYDEINIVVNLDKEYFLDVLRTLLDHSEVFDDSQINVIKRVLAQKIMTSLGNVDVEEDSFVSLYDGINSIAKNNNISIPEELMNDSNKAELFSNINKSDNGWKIYFVTKVVSQYIVDLNVDIEELSPNNSLGSFYTNTIKSLYSTVDDKAEIASKVLSYFDNSAKNIVNMAINISALYESMDASRKEILNFLWIPFSKIVVSFNDNNIRKINQCLLDAKKFNEMANLYAFRLMDKEEFEEKHSVFTDTVNNWLVVSPEYVSSQAGKIIDLYATCFIKEGSSINEEMYPKYREEILMCARRFDVCGDYFLTLSNELAQIALEKISKMTVTYKMVRSLVEHLLKNDISIVGSLTILFIGMSLHVIRNYSELCTFVSELDDICGKDKTNINILEGKSLSKYIDWILESLERLDADATCFKNIFDCFTMDRKTHSDIIETFCKEYYKNCKKGNAKAFAQFLIYMFNNGESTDVDVCAKVLSGLNKQKLDDLEDELRPFLRSDVTATRGFLALKEMAANTNRFSSLFKKK